MARRIHDLQAASEAASVAMGSSASTTTFPSVTTGSLTSTSSFPSNMLGFRKMISSPINSVSSSTTIPSASVPSKIRDFVGPANSSSNNLSSKFVDTNLSICGPRTAATFNLQTQHPPSAVRPSCPIPLGHLHPVISTSTFGSPTSSSACILRNHSDSITTNLITSSVLPCYRSNIVSNELATSVRTPPCTPGCIAGTEIQDAWRGDLLAGDLQSNIKNNSAYEANLPAPPPAPPSSGVQSVLESRTSLPNAISLARLFPNSGPECLQYVEFNCESHVPGKSDDVFSASAKLDLMESVTSSSSSSASASSSTFGHRHSTKPFVDSVDAESLSDLVHHENPNLCSSSFIAPTRQTTDKLAGDLVHASPSNITTLPSSSSPSAASNTLSSSSTTFGFMFQNTLATRQLSDKAQGLKSFATPSLSCQKLNNIEPGSGSQH
ncbi:unnamed protein product [Protopolystoma xenopodis]|uniref:Uncharacterized protein n=1 Tax=Protopolystoma xenopodis TaxID=117903 RepID=A0A448WKC5_9PLAT|nr:unnamed protein product [Protopolystoma xenopodis]